MVAPDLLHDLKPRRFNSGPNVLKELAARLFVCFYCSLIFLSPSSSLVIVSQSQAIFAYYPKRQIVLILSLYDSIGYLVANPTENGTEPLEYWEYIFTAKPRPGARDYSGITGFTLAVILAVMTACSMPCVRRSGRFEVGWQTIIITWLLSQPERLQRFCIYKVSPCHSGLFAYCKTASIYDVLYGKILASSERNLPERTYVIEAHSQEKRAAVYERVCLSFEKCSEIVQYPDRAHILLGSYLGWSCLQWICKHNANLIPCRQCKSALTRFWH